jgi:hypothetical protein
MFCCFVVEFSGGLVNGLLAMGSLFTTIVQSFFFWYLHWFFRLSSEVIQIRVCANSLNGYDRL